MESDEDIDAMTARLQMLESRLHVAKIAYLSRTVLEGKSIEYEDLRGIAKEYIALSYAIQKRKFGRVTLEMSVAKLLR